MTPKIQKFSGIAIAAIIVGGALVSVFNWYHGEFARASDITGIKTTITGIQTTLKGLRLQGEIQLLRGDRRELNADKSRIESRTTDRVMTMDDRRNMLKIEDKLRNVEEDLKVLNSQRGKGNP